MVVFSLDMCIGVTFLTTFAISDRGKRVTIAALRLPNLERVLTSKSTVPNQQ